ncbi:hypothetical protein ABMY26_09950 [Azospirillum sp. HJ39]|uniref:hypothetical protein n=1 Tax=Azospirillum sp. HJ39 TaxID=3159496 RepID=UPI003556809E
MGSGANIFAALDGDFQPLLACGWLLSMVQGTTVTVGLSDWGRGAGPCARGFMDLHILKRDDDDEALLHAAAIEARRLAALRPGDGALELSHGPPVGRFDLLLVGRPPVGRPLSGNPAYWNADAQRFRAVLVAPREIPSCLGRRVAILANGPPRKLPSFGIAQGLFPTISSVHLILDERTGPDRETEWLRRLDSRCPVQVSTVRRTTDAQTAAIRDVGGDILIVERPARFWSSIGFEWRLFGLLDDTPGAMLFTL